MSAPPKGILKQPTTLGVEHTYDVIRKSKSVELLDDGRRRDGADCHRAARSLDRAEQRALASRRSSAPPSPCRTDWNWKMQVLEEKVQFSNFLDEITSRVLSPAHLTLLGRASSGQRGSPAPQRRHHSQRHGGRKQRAEPSSTDRTRRWDDWVAALQRPGSWYQQEEGAGPGCDVTEEAGPKVEVLENKHRAADANVSLVSRIKVGQRATTFIIIIITVNMLIIDY